MTRLPSFSPLPIALLLWWLVSLGFALTTGGFTNDHFGRITPARQIVRYGELPFRDYFDPGYVLTELSSAALQRWLGDSLLGELLLVSSFIATGAALLMVLAFRLTRSYPIALGTAVVALLSVPRAYDFDKFLFYPLGILLCWNYVDRTTTRNLLLLAASVVVAGMFRYDNGIFIALSAAVTIVVVHWPARHVLARRLSAFVAMVLIGGAPYLIFLQANGGLGNAFDQMITYARREGSRTRLQQIPIPSPSRFRREPLPPAPPRRVYVRWDDAVADDVRADLEARYTLSDPVRHGEAENRTWSYAIADISRGNLRALVTDQRVTDTHLVDRANFTLMSEEPAWIRFRRAVPLLDRVWFSWPAEEAADALYWLFAGLPIIAGAMVLRRSATTPEGMVERARVLGVAVMCLAVTALILRDPIMARIGGAAAPAAVLSAWAVQRARRQRLAAAIAVLVVVSNVAAMADWSWVVRRTNRDVPELPSILRLMASSPPDLSLLPDVRQAGLIRYLRECTRPDDRIYASWFVPELYFFAQRAFAGGMVVTFGGHWSEPAHQRRIIAKMRSEQVPVVIHSTGQLAMFRASYPMLDAYLGREYREAGRMNVSKPPELPPVEYTVLVDRDRVPSGLDATSSMPCFR